MKNVFDVVGKPAPDRSGRIKELADMGFTWADLEGQPYWIDQLVTVDNETYREIKLATEKLWSIFDKTTRFVRGRHDLYSLLCVPEVLWTALDTLPLNGPGEISRYARFDFSVSHEGKIKLLEINADTPTAYVEASVATPWMCGQADNVWSPNLQMRHYLKQAWQTEQPQAVSCIAYGSHLEDTGTIDMLTRHSELPIRCVDTFDLWIDEGTLRDKDGRKIERIFMLYPKEWMAVDDGGEALAYAIESGNLTVFNSIHAILLQSKGMQAIVWGLHEINAPLFTAEEHQAIETYMLPTYNEPVMTGNFVSKAMFGREGGSVELYDSSGSLEIEDQDGYDTSTLFKRIFQERADLPKIDLHNGWFYLLTGMFVIHGIPCGIVGRAGGIITGNSSHFIAMGVKS